MRGRVAIALWVLFCVGFVGCDDGLSDEQSDQEAVSTVDSIPEASTTTTEAARELEWELADSLPGALRQPVAWSGGFAAINFPDGDVLDDRAPGELWYSTDGVDWDPGLVVPGFSEVYLLAVEGASLFALTGDVFDNSTPQTLWQRTEDTTWTSVLTDDRLELMAVGAGRVIAYRQNGFEVLGVFDTTTLAAVEYAGVPDEINPTENTIYQGRAIGLDDGFLANVTWLEGVSSTGVAPRRRLLYSTDGSTWIEHPTGDPEALLLPYEQSAAPVSDGLNLLTVGERRPGSAWVTDTGLDLEATPERLIDDATGTSQGFFSVFQSTIRHSTDGISWQTIDAPPSWSQLAEVDQRGFAGGTILTNDDAFIAIGHHGMFEGWVGLVEPATDIWIKTS